MTKGKILAISLISVLAVAVAVSVAVAGNGNGAPRGAHYNLNIIGVSKDKTADMTGNNGHRIFVNLDKSGTKLADKIMLEPSSDDTFHVTDANGTDGSATFELPIDVATTYTVWARAVGTPGGSADIYSCVIDETGEEYCPTEVSLTMTRGNGKVANFQNVTSDLLYFDIGHDQALMDACGGKTTVALFNPCLEGYFWKYDNNGLKVLQLRFYPVQ